MPGFQFVHVESYSRKPNPKGQSVSFVFGEAARRPGACEHVENPKAPIVVFGKSVDEVEALHDELVASATATTKAGKTRKIRSDQHTLLTVVASHPAAPGQDVEAVAAWQDRTVAWLRQEWGDRLQSVVRHDDEGHVHVHAYVLPADPEMRARILHPGAAAKEKSKAAAIAEGHDAKAANKIGDDAYKAAMRLMQDRFFDQVGVPSGLARIGPGRRRLDRAAWRAEQAQVEHAATSIAAADQAQAKARDVGERGRAFVARARAAQAAAVAAAGQAVAAADAADARRSAAEKAEREARQRAAGHVRQARREASQILTGARKEAERLRNWGERLGGVWSGLAGVRKRLERKADERVAMAEAKAGERVSGALDAARKEVGTELVDARRQVAVSRAQVDSAAQRVRLAEEARQKAERDAATERSGRLTAEREREVFRGRWADADNKLLAMQRGYRR